MFDFIPTGIAILALFVPLAVSAYFSYVGGVTGKPETRKLHPLSLGMMVVSLVAALEVSIRLGVWSSNFPFPSFFTIFCLLVITAIPAGFYGHGKENRRKRKEEAEAATKKLSNH